MCYWKSWCQPLQLLSFSYNNTTSILHTKPIFGRTEVSPLIEDNIEEGHDANHGIEWGQGSPGGELSIIIIGIVVDNHEDEEDENSGHKIHHHLQHQDQDVKRGQGFVFVFVTKNLFWRLEIIK